MKKSNMFLIGSVVLILLAVALVAILDKTSKNSNSGDVRARASGKQSLTVTGTVSAVDEIKSTVRIDSVQFTDTSLAGTPQNLGSWEVTAPGGFNFASVSPGMRVTVGVDSATFLVSTHTLTALTIAPAK
jgi:hypothetical protein